ncbi:MULTISPECIES: hypothetical protein [Methylotuvimicrobium]|uniref:Uncharacterized protein n=2 Tax=Methylotuvimicrobium TaxID=2822410 RepID=G4T3L4_META2|nr:MULTISPECIES: hypothetical protein [Methylotuvimicrobium]QCW82618.1 hypothetical protein EQU24_10515 [Methylotuvimicrobium buryatense]CCE23739.1 protein of unknown function [Methylotuvimicrobium alcaliphilum 20Z]
MNNKRILKIVYERPNHFKSSDMRCRTTCGMLVISKLDNGEERMQLKLDTIPLDSDFTGWFNVISGDQELEGFDAEYEYPVLTSIRNQIM